MTTLIDVGGDPERPRCTLRSGLLVPRRLPGDQGTVRVALVASTALLLAGDRVTVEVSVTGGLRLEVLETAGTVAYAMRGASARWDVRASVGPSSCLTWAGLPFVVADGAVVHRATDLDLDETAVAVLRESLVLGRTGQRGGVVETVSRFRRSGRPLLVESLRLDPEARQDPAVLAGSRCLDTVTVLGSQLPDAAEVLQLDGPGSIARRLVDQLHDSGLDDTFRSAALSGGPATSGKALERAGRALG
jgi:urease accessory protein